MPRPVSLEGTVLEVKQDYVYLGHTVQLYRNNYKKETDIRIGMGRAAFGRLRRVFIPIEDSIMFEDKSLRENFMPALESIRNGSELVAELMTAEADAS